MDATNVVTTCSECGEISRVSIPPKAGKEDYPYFLKAAELVDGALHQDCEGALHHNLEEGPTTGIVRFYDNALERRKFEDNYSDFYG